MSNRSRRKGNISRRLKTSHKKRIHDKKVIQSKISPEYRDINKKVTQDTQAAKAETQKPQQQLISVDEQITIDQLRKLIDNNQRKRERIRLSLDDKLYLQPLLAKYGNDYKKMVRDIKLNKMQWNEHQVQLKHKQYLKL